MAIRRTFNCDWFNIKRLKHEMRQEINSYQFRHKKCTSARINHLCHSAGVVNASTKFNLKANEKRVNDQVCDQAKPVGTVWAEVSEKGDVQFFFGGKASFWSLRLIMPSIRFDTTVCLPNAWHWRSRDDFWHPKHRTTTMPAGGPWLVQYWFNVESSLVAMSRRPSSKTDESTNH